MLNKKLGLPQILLIELSAFDLGTHLDLNLLRYSICGNSLPESTHWSTMIFFFKMCVVSYVCLYAEFGKNTQTSLASTVFTQIENLCVEKVKFGEKEYFAYLDVKAGNQDKA